MPDGDRYELIDGHLVERTVSTLASYVAGRVYLLVQLFCQQHGLGWVFPEGTSFQCFPFAPGQVRKPDTSFIRLDRLTAAQAADEGHCPVAPDLMVEVVSPNDLAYEIDRKVRDFLRAGTRLVWVVNPQVQTVQVHRAGSIGAILGENDELGGEDVLPGFRCRVGELFVLPTAPAPAS
jgi:Uma2 family endonuclease